MKATLNLQSSTLNPVRREPAARGGQVMILTVLALGGTILGATTVAGLLMLYQLRQATDMSNSAKAIFAADAGLEHAFFQLFVCKDNPDKEGCPAPSPSFSPEAGASVAVTCYDAGGSPLADCGENGVSTIHSVGTAGGASRALEAQF